MEINYLLVLSAFMNSKSTLKTTFLLIAEKHSVENAEHHIKKIRNVMKPGY